MIGVLLVGVPRALQVCHVQVERRQLEADIVADISALVAAILLADRRYERTRRVRTRPGDHSLTLRCVDLGSERVVLRGEALEECDHLDLAPLPQVQQLRKIGAISSHRLPCGAV